VGKVMRRVGAAKTKGEAENVLKAGGVYVGVEKMKVADPKAVVEEGWLLEGQVLLLRVGKGRFNIVKAV
jgi:tyrosyl-tRNA synthetase